MISNNNMTFELIGARKGRGSRSKGRADLPGMGPIDGGATLRITIGEWAMSQLADDNDDVWLTLGVNVDQDSGRLLSVLISPRMEGDDTREYKLRHGESRHPYVHVPLAKYGFAPIESGGSIDNIHFAVKEKDGRRWFTYDVPSAMTIQKEKPQP